MARAIPAGETAEPTAEDIAHEARVLREEYRHDPERRDDEPSPQAFYERAVQHEDVREILRRLANA